VVGAECWSGEGRPLQRCGLAGLDLFVSPAHQVSGDDQVPILGPVPDLAALEPRCELSPDLGGVGVSAGSPFGGGDQARLVCPRIEDLSGAYVCEAVVAQLGAFEGVDTGQTGSGVGAVHADFSSRSASLTSQPCTPSVALGQWPAAQRCRTR
jgi:hypothetical protein